MLLKTSSSSSRSVIIRAAAAAAGGCRCAAAKRRCCVAAAAALNRRRAPATAAGASRTSPDSSTASTSSPGSSAMSSTDDTGGGSSGQKLKILSFHGFMQTGLSFRSRVGSLRKALKSRAEFEFVDAPFLVGRRRKRNRGRLCGRAWGLERGCAPGGGLQAKEARTFGGLFTRVKLHARQPRSP